MRRQEAQSTRKTSLGSLDPIEKAVVAKFRANLSDLKAVVAELGADLSDLNAIVAGLGSDLSDLNAVVAGLGSDLSDLKAVVAELGANLSDHIADSTKHITWGIPLPYGAKLWHFDGSLVSTDGTAPVGTPVATLRPDGRFGGAVAVEEGTTNLLTTRTAPAQEVVTVTPGQKYTLSAYGSGTAQVYQQKVEDSQSDWQQGTLSGVVATAAGDLVLANNPALSFDESMKASVDIPHSASLNVQNLTLEAWVKLRSYTNYSTIVGKWHDGSDKRQYQIAVRSDGTVRFELSDVGTWDSNYMSHSTTEKIPIESWVHIAATYDGQTKKVYFNGAEVLSVNISIPIFESTTPAYIGGYNSKLQDRYSDALIDEVRIWNVARTQSQIQTDMHRRLTGTEPGLVGYWRFDEGSGTIAYDATPNANHGTIHGAAWTTSGTRVEQSGTRTSPILDLSPVGTAGGSSISWTATTPAGTSVTVETNLSLDGGQTWQGWQQATNGGPIPGISVGTDLSNAQLQTRVTLSTADTTVTPRVDSLTVEVGHQAVAVAAESLSQSSPLTFTAVGNRVRLVPSAGVTNWQLEQKPFATSFVDGTRAAGVLRYPQLLDKKRGTLSVWINPHVVADYNNFFPMSLSTGRFLLFFGANGVSAWDFGPNNSGPYTPAGTVVAGQWTMHTLTWDADAGVYRYYVNGEFVGERQDVEPDSLPSALPTVTNYGALLDELLILPFAATPEQIQAWYAMGAPFWDPWVGQR